MPTLVNDSIVFCNKQLLESMKNDPKLDYNSTFRETARMVQQQSAQSTQSAAQSAQSVQPAQSAESVQSVHETAPDVDLSFIHSDFFTVLAYIVMISLLALLCYFVWKHRYEIKEWFTRKKGSDTADDEDSIYGVDFDARIDEAMTAGDHQQAIRYIYLRTLRWLSDNGLITWKPGTTPWQYSRQLKQATMRSMTDTFMRIRYGNYQATSTQVEQMLEWEQALYQANAPQDQPTTEGGES